MSDQMFAIGQAIKECQLSRVQELFANEWLISEQPLRAFVNELGRISIPLRAVRWQAFLIGLLPCPLRVFANEQHSLVD